MPTATLVPFGARAERTPYTVTLEAGSFAYDPARRVWHRTQSLTGSRS